MGGRGDNMGEIPGGNIEVFEPSELSQCSVPAYSLQNF